MRRIAVLAAAATIAAVATLAVLALTGVLDGDDGSSSSSRSSVLSLPGVQADGGAAGNQVHRIYERSRAAVVFIEATVTGPGTSPFGPDPQGGVATGTGWLYDGDGHVVTNAHVVENATDVAIHVGESELVKAKVVGVDLSTDLAVLRIDPGGLHTGPLPVGDVKNVEVGDPVVAMGNPLGLEDTVTAGIVSALQRQIRAPNGYAIDGAIQSDAAINPGNSGGPLFDFDGRVIGVNSQIATAPGGGGEGFIGIGFAIPTTTVRVVVPQLIRTGRVNRPYLGIATVTLTPSLAQQLGLGLDRGALVASVAPGSPAARAGIRGSQGAQTGAIAGGGDVIVAVDGEPVATSQDLADRVAAAKVGDELKLEIVRDGKRIEKTVRLGRLPG
jgi:S1-C subfamily serine protease